MNLYNRSSAGRSLLDTVAFRAISQAATVLSYVVLAHALAKEQFGVYSLLYAFIPVFSTLASLGLEQMLRRYQPEMLQSGRNRTAAWLLRRVSWARLATNLALLALILLAWNYVAPQFNAGPYRPAFMGFALAILLHFQVRILQLALSSHMLHRYSVGSVALMSVIKLVAYVALSHFGSLDLHSAIIVDTGAYAAAYALLRWAHHRHAALPAGETTEAPVKAERARMYRYALLNNFNDAGVLLMYSTLDTFFIAKFGDMVAVGIYGFFSRLNEMTANILPVRLLDNVVQPLLFATPRDEAAQRLPRYFTFLLNMNLLVQLPILAYACAYHREIAQLLSGGKFVADSWMLPLLLGFATLNVVADPASMMAQYEERAGILLTSKLFALYNLLAMLVLVPLFGIYGAALASGSAQTFKNAFIWWHVRRHAVWTNARAALLTMLLLWGGTVAVCVGVKSLLHTPALLQLLFGALIVGAAMLLFMRSAALSASDRQLVEAVASGRGAAALRWAGLVPRRA